MRLRNTPVASGSLSETGPHPMTATPPPSVLGIFAHPDDESLLAGGVLARHADRGARTAVVTPPVPGTAPAAELAVFVAAALRVFSYGDARNPGAAPGGSPWSARYWARRSAGLWPGSGFSDRIPDSSDAVKAGRRRWVRVRCGCRSALSTAGRERRWPGEGSR